MNIIEEKLTTSHWFFQNILIFIKEWVKKKNSNLMCFIINHDFYVITFWMHYTLFIIIVIFRRNKLIVIDNWIFYVLHFLRLFMISFKCCLISLKYFLTDSVFLSPLHIIYLFTIRLRLQKERLLKKIEKHIKVFLKE